MFATELNNQYGVYEFGRCKQGTQYPYTYEAESSRYGLTLSWPNVQPKSTVFAPLLGEFNIGNLAAVVVTLMAMGYAPECIAHKALKLKPVPGRMQIIKGRGNQPLCIVDYAFLKFKYFLLLVLVFLVVLLLVIIIIHCIVVWM